MDITGVFGPANSSLNGKIIQMTFTVDTSKGNYSTHITNGVPVGDQVVGGRYYIDVGYGSSYLTSPVSASVTISGISKAIAGNYASAFSALKIPVTGNSWQGFGADDNSYTPQNDTNDNFHRILAYVESPTGQVAGSILSPYSGPLGTDPILTGFFEWWDLEPYQRDGTCPCPGSERKNYAWGYFTTGPIPPTPDVPLPAALPLFATGLGALGLLGWRGKRKKSAA